MSYEDDIRRDEARKRLQARLERNGAAEPARAARSRDSHSSPSSRRGDTTRPSRSRRNGGERGYESSRRSSGRRAPERESGQRRPSGSAKSGVSGILSTIASAVAAIGSFLLRGVQAIGRGWLGLVERFGWKAVIATAIVVILALFLIVSGVRGCTSSGESSSSANASQSAAATSTSTSASAASASASAASSSSTSTTASSNATKIEATSPVAAIEAARPEVDQTEIDESHLTSILDNQFAEMLLEQAKTNNDAHWIAAHPDEYLEDGTIVRYKMLRLAAKEPQAIPFVRDWPDKYCADEPDYSEAHTDESSNGVPRLYQWDKRWGYTEYSSTTFALTGCAPTSLAMVYQAITGDTSKSPYDMGVYAANNGYATEYDGTDGSLFSSGASGLGLSCHELGIDASALTQALADGQIVVVNVGPGDFTDSGHYFVATGLADDGTVMINDPFSAERSATTWDATTIAGQTRAMYAFTKA